MITGAQSGRLSMGLPCRPKPSNVKLSQKKLFSDLEAIALEIKPRISLQTGKVASLEGRFSKVSQRKLVNLVLS